MKEMKEEWKIAILAVWIGGLLAHAYRFFNYLPTWDSMYNFSGTGHTFSSGRWFLEYVGKITTDYELPWINGALSLFYISIAVIMLIELLDLKSKWSIVVSALLIVTFPTITSTFAYMFTADGYMLSFLLAVAGIYFTEKYKFGVVPGVICVCLSMSIYQAYLSVSLVLVAVICIKRIFIEEYTFLKVFLKEYMQGFTLAGGAVLNNVLTKVMNASQNVELSSYQGINDVHLLTLEDSLTAVSIVQNAFQIFFQIGGWREKNIYSLLNSCIFGLILVVSIYFVVKKKLYKRPLELLCVIAAYLCMPLLIYIIRFVSMQVNYHTLMLMSACFIYLMAVMYIEHLTPKEWLEKGLKIAAIIMLGALIYNNTLTANYAYYNMNLSYEKTYAISLDVLRRIEETEGFDADKKIAVIGSYDASAAEMKPLVPDIAGVTNDIFLMGQDHYFAMWKYCMGREYSSVSGEEREQLKRMSEYAQMDCYPYAGCVRIIGETIVVKMAEAD